MSIIEALYYLIIRPLELVYEFIFSLSYKTFGNAVISIVALSISVGLMSLPLYSRADELHMESDNVEQKIKKWRSVIKSTFRGDEQVMMLQAYYRENNYHPLMIMKSSVSLLLQIPFFIAAYRVLSTSVALEGVSFGPIADLSAPDGIISAGIFSINLLPILMTVINIISGTIYTKNMEIKAKIQLYVTALVFLVLLYTSPSGMVLYWTLNNVFSLIKNIVTKLLPRKEKKKKTVTINKYSTAVFILTSLTTSLFIGLMIPADMFSDSVGDFLTNYRTIDFPYFILISLLISLGFFTVWGSIYYFVLKKATAISVTMCSITFCALINYFAFYKSNGDINRYLYIKTYINNTPKDSIINLLTMVLVIMVLAILIKNRPVLIKYAACLALITVSAVSFVYMKEIIRINGSYSFVENQRDYPELTLSADKPNVIVIMLDRACGYMTPYIMNEQPELQSQFDGFTYYPNSLSYGLCTNIGAPALYGGYDYTPDSMNSRNELSLEAKHNESLLVLPVIFNEHGYNVTVLDPPYACYKSISDLSIFNQYPGIDSYITYGVLNPSFDVMTDDWIDFMERNMFSYSLRLASPVAVRKVLYDNGYYNDLNRRLSGDQYFQVMHNRSTASGIDSGLLNSYYSLLMLPNITTVTEDTGSNGSLVMLTNEITHEPALLEEPSYTLSFNIDNSAYDQSHTDRFILDGTQLYLDTPEAMGEYHAQAGALGLLGNWFDYLREIGVYDNTRIIIVSDHGSNICPFDLSSMTDPRINVYNLNCLVMVKDFGASGFNISDDFITNAETPALALNNLIDNPVNPFTGNPITTLADDSDNYDHMFLISNIHNVTENNGNVFMPGLWYTYNPQEGNIFDYSAWEYQGEY